MAVRVRSGNETSRRFTYDVNPKALSYDDLADIGAFVVGLSVGMEQAKRVAPTNTLADYVRIPAAELSPGRQFTWDLLALSGGWADERARERVSRFLMESGEFARTMADLDL